MNPCPPPTLVTLHPLYLALGRSQAERQSAYRALFRNQFDEAALADIELAIAQGQPLGNDRFREAVCAATGVWQLLPRRGRLAGKDGGEGNDALLMVGKSQSPRYGEYMVANDREWRRAA
jgi:hypothetical protein